MAGDLKGRSRISKGTRKAHDLPLATEENKAPRTRLSEGTRKAHDLPREYSKGGKVSKKGRKRII